MQIACPQCSQMLEAPVPLPSLAKCPFCSHVFAPTGPVPPPTAAPPFGAPPFGAPPFGAPPFGAPAPPFGAPAMPSYMPRSGFAEADVAARITPPAIAMIVAGAIWTLMAIGQLALAISNFGKPQPMPFVFPNMDPQAMQQGQEIGQVLALVVHPISIVLGGVIIFGAIRMLQRRSYGLAVTSCVLVMLPITCNFACCLGIPFGIWALVVLCSPGMRASFP